MTLRIMFGVQERNFVREILADPESPGPRLVYADWLHDQGDVRAQAVWVGVERKLRQQALMGSLETDLRAEELDRLQKNLNIDYSRQCRELLPQIEGVAWGKFEGGVIEQVTIAKPEAFARHAGEILEVQPVYQFLCSAGLNDQTLPLILGASEMVRLGGLCMGGNYDGPVVPRVLSESPHIANLRYLNLSFTEIGDQGAIHLAGAAHLAGLRDLTLHRNELTESGFQALCKSPYLASVERLMLGWNKLGTRAGEVLAKSSFNSLRWLDLSDTKLNPATFIMLVETGRLNRIEWLNVARCGLEDSAIAVLVTGAGEHLTRLNLVGNKLKSSACEALAASRLPRLLELNLELHESVAHQTADALAHSEWLPRLEKLRLFGEAWPSLSPSLAQARLDRLTQLHLLCLADENVPVNIFDESMALLANNPSLGNLRLLELHMPITTKGVEQLAKLKSLLRLKIPQALKEFAPRLKSELPACKIEYTSCVF